MYFNTLSLIVVFQFVISSQAGWFDQFLDHPDSSSTPKTPAKSYEEEKTNLSTIFDALLNTPSTTSKNLDAITTIPDKARNVIDTSPNNTTETSNTPSSQASTTHATSSSETPSHETTPETTTNLPSISPRFINNETPGHKTTTKTTTITTINLPAITRRYVDDETTTIAVKSGIAERSSLHKLYLFTPLIANIIYIYLHLK